jgi:CBS domain containing-hemolysin-like protein
MHQIQHRIQRWLVPATPERLSSEDLKTMAEIGEAHGSLEEEERELIHSIVEFGDTAVRAIMINRLDVTAIPVTATLPEALALIRNSGHSRLPLYIDHLDNILGIIYAKDLLPYLRNGNGTPRIDWTRLMRPPMFVPQGKKLDDLLKDFQRRRTHLAIVVDEYGGTAGMVTLEDVLEEVVGEIRDEHDEAETEYYEKIDDYQYRFDARIDLDDLNDLLDLDLDTASFDFETLGGLIFHLIGDIPSEGEEVRHDRLMMRVETVENNRIRYVHVQVEALVEDEDVSEKRASENS